MCTLVRSFERIQTGFEFVQLIAATKFCRSDNDFHKINRLTRGELLRELVPATCRSDLSPRVSWPLRHEDKAVNGLEKKKKKDAVVICTSEWEIRLIKLMLIIYIRKQIVQEDLLLFLINPNSTT